MDITNPHQKQENPLAEEASNSSSTSNKGPVAAHPSTQTASMQKGKRNSGICLIAILLVLILMALTCPSQDDHQQAISRAITEHIFEEETSEDEFMPVLGSIASGLANVAIEQLLTVDKYLIFSIGTLHHLSGETEHVSLGIFDHVFILNSKALQVDI